MVVNMDFWLVKFLFITELGAFKWCVFGHQIHKFLICLFNYLVSFLEVAKSMDILNTLKGKSIDQHI